MEEQGIDSLSKRKESEWQNKIKCCVSLFGIWAHIAEVRFPKSLSDPPLDHLGCTCPSSCVDTGHGLQLCWPDIHAPHVSHSLCTFGLCAALSQASSLVFEAFLWKLSGNSPDPTITESCMLLKPAWLGRHPLLAPEDHGCCPWVPEWCNEGG